MAKNAKRTVRYERVRYDSGQYHRILALMAVFGLLAFVPVIFQLYMLMVVDHDYYRDLALRNQSRSTLVAAAFFALPTGRQKVF